MSAPRIAVVGAGAVGCWFGGVLARAGFGVTMIGRPQHVEAMRRDGLRLESAAFDEHVAVQAGTELADAAGAQLVLVCVKSTDTDATGAGLAAHVAPAATVLSLQNGVDNAPRLALALGRPVAPAVVYVATEMAGPGHVRHLGRGELVIPADVGGTVPAADVVAWFARAGVAVELSDNVVGALWSKLVLNCAYNAMSAIAGLPYGRLVEQAGVKETMHDAVLECLAVAAAAGVTPAGAVFEAVERIARTMPGQFSSTAQDVRRGKPSEIDHLNGFIAREGARLGVATPVNRTLWALVKAIEARAAAPGAAA